MPNRLTLLPVALTGGVALLALWLFPPDPITAVDQEQPRLDVAAPLPRGSAALTQSFQAAHAGLSSVEVLAVVYPEGGPAALALSLFDSRGQLLAVRTFSRLEHNAPVRLDFAPIPDSAGAAYLLRLTGAPDNSASAWAYSLDGYARGALSFDGSPVPGDLRFVTTYTLLWPDLLARGARAVGRLALVAPQLWLVLFVPGLLLLDLAQPAGVLARARWARWGLALALSLSLLGLAWLWLGLAGLAWSPARLGAAYGLAVLLLAARRWRRWAARRTAAPVAASPAPSRLATGLGHDAAMLLLLLAGLLARLLAARDLALPPWVDSSHHLLTARLLADAGHVPATYQPWLPVDGFYYHFGVHVVVVAFHWFTGLAWPEAFLLLGQVLNGLMPLAAYTLAACLTRRRRAALGAAFVVAVISYFPGYYLTWGRYSQLAGLLLLAPALGVFWQGLRRAPALGQSPSARLWSWLAPAVLAAGLLLNHYRVFFFFVVFAVVALALHLLGRTRASTTPGRRWNVRWLAGASLAGGLLALPWLMRLFQVFVSALAVPGGLAGSQAYNAFPSEYFQSPLERAWLGLALVALAWGLVRRRRALAWLGLATAAIFGLLLAGPTTWLVNTNAWAISLFLPAAVALGWGGDQWLLAGERLADDCRWRPGAWRRRARLALAAALLAVASAAGGWGAGHGWRAQVAILNPATILATGDDLDALAWVERNVSAEAIFLVNGWEWLNGIWAGSDGGAWLLPLAGRRTTLPPIDYAYGTAQQQAAIVAFNTRLASLADFGAPETLAWLHDAGVTHVFIGARGGVLRPELFVGRPQYPLLFTNGAAWVFAFDDSSTP